MRVPLALNTTIFTLSALRKMRDLLSVEGHFLMGSGRLYPGWLLPVAFVQEATMLALLHYDRPLGVLGCCAFIGGICHASLAPGGTVARAGLKALAPLGVVLLSTLALAPRATDHGGPISRRLGISRLRPLGFAVLCAAVGSVGAAFGVAAAAANA